MAFMPQAKTDEEIRSLTVSKVKAEYQKLAAIYYKILNLDLVYCHKCNEHLSSDTFYSDKNYKSGYFPICKKCLLAMVEQRDKKTDEPNETKESVQRVLQLMDLPYIDSFYENCVKGAQDGMKERNRKSPFSTYITALKSLPNWKGLKWKDSDYGADYNNVTEEDAKIVQKTVKRGKKTFGDGYSNQDYMFLMAQYDDWCQRTKVDSKSQETYVTQICLQLLDIEKDRKDGKDVSNKLKTLDALMNSANLQPKQNVSNAATDSLTFSQMILKWEEDFPVPNPEPDLTDVSGIGRNIRVWFSGWLANALGLNTPQSMEYLEEVEKYTVTKPEMHTVEGSSSTYNKIFGSGD